MVNRMPQLTCLDIDPVPLIGRGHPGTEDNENGLEGGIVTRHNGRYHLFSTEVCGRPDSDFKFAYTRLAYWCSEDGQTFERLSTLVKSARGEDGKPRETWTPYPIYNHDEGRWNLFHAEHGGRRGSRIPRCVSQTPGPEGIAGPYAYADDAMDATGSQPWESNGVPSFFPYQLDDGTWRAFYGGHNIHAAGLNSTRNDWKFQVGLARADRLAGPWTRLPGNPVQMDPRFVENPVVHRLPDNTFITLYDGETVHGIAYAFSKDGETWSPEQQLFLPSPPTPWAWWLRTPLGLVETDDGDNSYWLYYTAFDGEDRKPPKHPAYHKGFGTLGRIRVRVD